MQRKKKTHSSSSISISFLFKKKKSMRKLKMFLLLFQETINLQYNPMFVSTSGLQTGRKEPFWSTQTGVPVYRSTLAFFS